MKRLKLSKRYRVGLWIASKAHICLKIFGLAPFSIQTITPSVSLRHTHIETFRFSKIGSFYNLLLSIVLSTFMTVLVYQDLSNHNFNREDIVMQFIYAIQVIARAMSTGFILILWTFRQRNAICIMNDILQIQNRISTLGKRPSDKRSVILLSLHLIINISIWITFWITEIAMNPYVGNYKVTLWTITTSIVIYWFIIEYVIAVSLIARILKTINKNLSNFKKRHSAVFFQPSVCDLSQPFGTKSLHNQLSSLRSLIRIREKISDVSQNVENFFAFTISCCIVYTFVAVVYINYKFIINSNVSFLHFSGFAMWLAIHLYPIILLSAVVTETSKQGRHTGLIVRKMLISPIKREIETELEQFSLHLLHDDFAFTSYGLFALDLTMLNSLTGATMTYLVILLQPQTPNAANR